jgi:hypothetical protein
VINASGRVLRFTGDAFNGKERRPRSPALTSILIATLKGRIPFLRKSFGRFVVELVAPSSMKRIGPCQGREGVTDGLRELDLCG